ncbi:MAG: GNAT family N-acetyltransferase [Candidatus Acidiferrales bacterium]
MRPHAQPRSRDEIRCEILPREEFAHWDTLVDASPHGTVFHYSWWLECTTPRFEILAARDGTGAVVGGIPLPRARRWGLELIHPPVLTPYLGPVFDLRGAEANSERLSWMRGCGELLAQHIEKFDSFRCTAGACAPDLQGLLWAGFRAELAYTFRFSAASSKSAAEGIARTHKQQLVKARRLNLTVSREDKVAELLELSTQTFARQGLKSPYHTETVKRLWAAAQERGQAQIYVARTPGGNAVAALLTVHDRRTTYQIISGVDTAHRELPGPYAVLWQAVEDTLAAGRDFDFEGSGLRGVERFYRRWGAAAVPVWKIEKAGSWRGAFYQFLIRRRQMARSNRSTARIHPPVHSHNPKGSDLP